MLSTRKNPLLAKYAGALSIAEVGLGSVLHSFHVPFAGHFLAANQSLLLTLAVKKISTRAEAISLSNGISTMAALAKALAPAGKRLTPMLALTVQGSLYSIGIAFLGRNLFGVLLGAFLLSLWSFAQPLLLSYIFFGETFFTGLLKLWTEIANFLHLPLELGLWLVLFGILLKAALTLLTTRIAWAAPLNFEENYFATTGRLTAATKKLRPSQQQRGLSPFRGALRDLFHPWFILSFFLSIGFFAFSRNETVATVLMYAVRSVVCGFLLFWAARIFLKNLLLKTT